VSRIDVRKKATFTELFFTTSSFSSLSYDLCLIYDFLFQLQFAWNWKYTACLYVYVGVGLKIEIIDTHIFYLMSQLSCMQSRLNEISDSLTVSYVYIRLTVSEVSLFIDCTYLNIKFTYGRLHNPCGSSGFIFISIATTIDLLRNMKFTKKKIRQSTYLFTKK